MNSGELKRAKRDIRRRIVAVRDAVPAAERARLGALVADRFLSLPEMDAADTVLAFWSFGSELPTAPLIDALGARGKRVALPCIVDGELEARTYVPGDRVTETSFGAFEPVDGTLDATEIDVIAVPAVAFDRECRRIGYGGGFYDRFLPTTREDAVRAGFAAAVQLLPPGELLPAGHFDAQVHLVVTESETVRCRS